MSVFIDLYRSYAARIVAGLIALVVACHLTLDRALFDETLRVLATTVMAMLAIFYATAAWKCLTTPGWPDRDQWGAFCWWFVGICGTVTGLHSLFYRTAGRPAWVFELPTSNAWAYGLIALGVVGLVGPGFFSGALKLRTKVTLATLGALAVASIVYIAVARPDLKPVSDWIETHWIGKSAPPRECPPA